MNTRGPEESLDADTAKLVTYFRNMPYNSKEKSVAVALEFVMFLLPTSASIADRVDLRNWIEEQMTLSSKSMDWKDGRSLRAFVRFCDKLARIHGAKWYGPEHCFSKAWHRASIEHFASVFYPYSDHNGPRCRSLLIRLQGDCRCEATKKWLTYADSCVWNRDELTKLLTGYVEGYGSSG